MNFRERIKSLKTSSSGAQNTSERHRDVILICAYAADPKIPSEPTIGWAFVKSALLASQDSSHQVVLLTNVRSGEAMQKWAASEGLGDRLLVVAVGLGKGLRWLERPRINLVARVEYLCWYVAAARKVRSLAATRSIRLAHHVTFATEMLPTPIAFAGADAYKVWGPIGADGSADVFRIRPFLKGTKREYLLQRTRDALSGVLVRWFGSRVDLVIASQKGRLYSVLLQSGKGVFAFPNLVLPPDLVEDIRKRTREELARERKNKSDVQIMCVGHLIPRKRFELAIAMLTQAPLRSASVHFFGSATGGDLKPYLELARSAGVSDRVKFHGKVARSEVLDFMATADVLFHPAGREGAVGVIGEATSAGIPVVCFDGTGAALVLKAAAGAGVVLDSELRPTLSNIAYAVAEAAAMERTSFADWSSRRFDELERILIQHVTSPTDAGHEESGTACVLSGGELDGLHEVLKN